MVYSAKQPYYNDDEISPFNLNYAAMAGIDVPTGHSYHNSNVNVIRPGSYWNP